MAILREPFLHFVALGVAIFGLYAWIGDSEDGAEIIVSSGQQDSLIASFEQTWQRPPTPSEFRGLVQDYIRQEIAYREAGAMELDRNDVVIRRRLRQKLELLTESLASMAPPTEAELEDYYRENADDYRRDPVYSLQQIFFSTDRRGAQAQEDATAVLAEIESGTAIDVESMGDSISLPKALRSASRREVAATFGTGFADALVDLPVGTWTGPVPSGYGVHLVRVGERIDSRVPPLAEVEQAVRSDLLSDRRSQAVDAMYQNLADSYTITIEPLETQPATGDG